MKRNMKRFLKAAEVAVGTGLYLLDRSQRFAPHMRDKLVDQIDDLRDLAKDTYQAATDRVASVTKSLRRSNTGGAGWHVLRFAVGLARVYRPEPVEVGLHLRNDPLRPASGAA
jgi:hypothetical protein